MDPLHGQLLCFTVIAETCSSPLREGRLLGASPTILAIGARMQQGCVG